MHKEELAGSASGRSVPWSPRASVKGSPRSQEGLVRLRDLASPVRPRSVHGSRRPSPARWEGSRGGSKRALMTDDVVQRLEEHDDEQVRHGNDAVTPQQLLHVCRSFCVQVLMLLLIPCRNDILMGLKAVLTAE